MAYGYGIYDVALGGSEHQPVPVSFHGATPYLATALWFKH